MSTRPKTLVSNSRRICVEIETANLRAIRVAGVVDEHVDAAHALLAGLERPCIVVGDADIRADAVRAGLARDLLDAGVVAAGEDDLMPRLPRLFDDGRADPLTAAGYQKTSWWP